MRTKKGFGPITPEYLIAACAFLICFALAGYADQFGDFTYVEYDTYIEITDYPDDATGDVVIPNEIVGKPVTSIGVWAFFNCTFLTSVSIPDSVTSIGYGAFAECNRLTSVTIPDSVTSIGARLFTASWWSLLTAIAVDGANPAYSSMNGVLFDKTQTTLLQYPQGRAGGYTIPDSVTSIAESAFYNSFNLASVTIPDSVSSIGESAFAECTNLTSVTIHGGVTSIGGRAFAECTNLTSVTIHGGVTSIGIRAFAECTSLTSVSIPDSVTSIAESAFYNSFNLASVTIPDSVSSIGESAFGYCESLTSVTIPSGVTSIEDRVFEGCAGLTSVSIPDSVTSIGESAFAECEGLTSVTIGSGVFSIGQEAFSLCTSLASVYIKGNPPGRGMDVFFAADNATVYYLPGTKGWEATYGGRPTEEISVLPDLLIVGAPVAGLEGWFLSEWFGYYSSALAPWLVHGKHGFIYRYPESTAESFFIYDDAMGAWWWTNQSMYPFIYAFDPPADNAGTDIEAEWLWYFEDTKTPRSFGVMTGDNAGSFLFFGP